jgi:pimeloyl-ACP methyl ester carboxylesterase
MDSPDQGAKNIPLGRVSLRNDSLIIAAPALMGKYAGGVQNDSVITGIWTQRGNGIELNIKKLREVFAINRPQEPKPPYPYVNEEVTFPNKKFNIFLSGTLSIPEGKGPFTAVVLISGSGPQNRDEALMGHKPFQVIADWLARQGIAVLRYDDRGVGKSQGDYTTATTADLATDAEAAFLFLRQNPKINPGSVGLIGHSEGGIIAPIVASTNKEVAFIVSLAGSGVTGEEILYRQSADISRLSGIDEATIRENNETSKKLYAIVKKEKDNVKAEEKVFETYSDILAGKNLSPEEFDRSINQLKASFGASTYPWFRYFLITDPAGFWKKVKCPVLALNGDKDLQVAADVNLPAIEKALKAGGNNNVKTVKLPGLNHLFQHCKTGLPNEYNTIEETFSPEVLEMISSWILSLKVSR